MNQIEERLKHLGNLKKIDKKSLQIISRKVSNADDIIVYSGCQMFIPDLAWNKLKTGELVVLKNGTFIFLEGGYFPTIHEIYFKNIVNIYKTSTNNLCKIRIHDPSAIHFEFHLLTEEQANTIIKELL